MDKQAHGLKKEEMIEQNVEAVAAQLEVHSSDLNLGPPEYERGVLPSLQRLPPGRFFASA